MRKDLEKEESALARSREGSTANRGVVQEQQRQHRALTAELSESKQATLVNFQNLHESAKMLVGQCQHVIQNPAALTSALHQKLGGVIAAMKCLIECVAC